jgi:hypothetical protein
MANIQISGLLPIGYDLFNDTASFLNELATEELQNFGAGYNGGFGSSYGGFNGSSYGDFSGSSYGDFSGSSYGGYYAYAYAYCC